MGLAETEVDIYCKSVANGVWGFALTILRQVKIPLVPAYGGEFCSCIQCGIFVRCYYKELFPQAQIAPFCPGGRYGWARFFIVQVRVYGLPSSFNFHICLLSSV